MSYAMSSAPSPFRRSALVCALALMLAGPAGADSVLHILHTNDMHSRLEPVDKFGATCSPEKDAAGECFGGSARLATMLARLRDAFAGEPVLLLDAGDQFQGSLLYTALKGAAEAEMMTALAYDAMAPGNHEFDDGPEGLAAFAAKVPFPLVAGNMDVSAVPGLETRIKPCVVLQAGGLKVGILGAITPDTAEIASPGPAVRFEDPAQSLAAHVAELQAEGVDKIIALTHLGLAADRRLAAAVPGIDAIVGGHSHTLLSNAPGGAGRYPVMEGAVPIVQAGAHGRWIGHLKLTFDDVGHVIAAVGNTIALDATVPPDPEIAARIAELAQPLAAIRAQVVGEAAAPIDNAACRMAECAMGNLVAEAMLAAVRDQGVSIALQNGGGLRAALDQGPVTMGGVLSVLPFQNTLATFRAPGAVIRAALENGVSQAEDGAGRFPQVAGLRFAWDRGAAPGARVGEIEVRQGEAWAPLDPEASYLVVTNDYMRRGGDGYAMFVDAAEAYDFGPGLDAVLARYLSGLGGPFTPFTDGRIRQK